MPFVRKIGCVCGVHVISLLRCFLTVLLTGVPCAPSRRALLRRFDHNLNILISLEKVLNTNDRVFKLLILKNITGLIHNHTMT